MLKRGVMTTIPSIFTDEQAKIPSSTTAAATQQNVQIKKKRNLPGMPDPDAEVIALSPKTLLATNRFICEICNKGFQRDQNLQLHRRGHNLPWKLRQRTGDEIIRKRVYVCPEPTCIHHDPSRALGDLTGVKKHFCRKHGEKKWKCDRCAKKYAVVSDWKAHMKTCGTREYRCDCGTLFSRRDSFITHRAFCDALAQESARTTTSPSVGITNEEGTVTVNVQAVTITTTTSNTSPPPPPLTPSTGVLSPVLSVHNSDLRENQGGGIEQLPIAPQHSTTTSTSSQAGSASSSRCCDDKVSNNSGVIASVHGASAEAGLSQFSGSQTFSGLMSAMNNMDHHGAAAPEPVSLSLSSSFYITNNSLPLFPASPQYHPIHYANTPPAAISATALLQKAAQIGATSSGSSSFLRSLGLAMPTSSNASPSFGGWVDDVKLENNPSTSGLALNVSTGLTDIMMMSPQPTTMFGVKPTTVDFLGLGISHGGASNGGFPTYLSRVGIDGLDVAAQVPGTSIGAVNIWDDSSDDRKPTL